MALSTKIQGTHYLQGNVQVYNVRMNVQTHPMPNKFPPKLAVPLAPELLFFVSFSCFAHFPRPLGCREMRSFSRSPSSALSHPFFGWEGFPTKIDYSKKGTLIGVWLQGLSPQGSGHPGRGDSSPERHASTKVDTHLRRPAFALVAATPRCPRSVPSRLLRVVGSLCCGCGSPPC